MICCSTCHICLVVDNAKPCPDYQQVPLQQQHFQQPLNSDEESGGYRNSRQIQQQLLQGRAFAAQTQYYSNPGSHSQLIHATSADFNPQSHHKQPQGTSMHSQYPQPVAASAADEYLPVWQQSVSHAGDIATANCSSQYCDFDVIGSSRQRVVHNVKLKQQLTNGCGPPATMQHGFIGGQRQRPHCIDVSHNHCIAQDHEPNILGMKQCAKAGADRSQVLQYNSCQQPDTLLSHQQTAAEFTGQKPRQFIAPGQHSVSISRQPMTPRDAFTSYHNLAMIEHHQPFTLQQQQQPWRNSQSYIQTGCCAFLIILIFASLF